MIQYEGYLFKVYLHISYTQIDFISVRDYANESEWQSTDFDIEPGKYNKLNDLFDFIIDSIE